MALKALMLRRKIAEKKTALEELRKKADEFQKREAELEQATNEATGEDLNAVEEEIEKFTAEKGEHEAEVSKLEGEIEQLEGELKEEEERSAAATGGKNEGHEARKENKNMEVRTKFYGMNMQERDAFFAREDVKGFLDNVRSLAKEKRSITGSELLIPNVVLPMIREETAKYSKLIKFVKVQQVGGTARQTIMGTVPEAVWTEMCAVLNELALNFNAAEVDGYKVGGFIPVCNAVLEDNDVNLASTIISALGEAIGYALDKAILYGTGTKMPLGIVTRLAQTAKPSGYSTKARAWADLHTSNVKTITAANSTGVKLFQNIVTESAAAKSKGSTGGKFWAMNEVTYAKLMAEALTINAAGAVVTGATMTMPVIGGDIVLLDFIPDNNIIGGYGDRYLLAERAGTSIRQSEHARFIEDQTVFAGTARYDGKPVIAESFVVLGLSATAPTTSVTFASDEANKTQTGDV